MNGTDRRVFGWTDGWMVCMVVGWMNVFGVWDGWMYGYKDIFMDEWIDDWMGGWFV
jgi:hypothetical protein